jgi:hypothetical protein
LHLDEARAIESELLTMMMQPVIVAASAPSRRVIGRGGAGLAMAAGASGETSGSAPWAARRRRLPVAVGVAFGRDERETKVAVRVFRSSREVMRLIDTIKARAKGEVDIASMDVPKAATAKAASSIPAGGLAIGSSISHCNGAAGSLGCFVRRPGGPSGDVFAIGNNHILACLDKGSLGDPILHPAARDGGLFPGHEVGALESYIPLSKRIPNMMDAALMRLRGNLSVDTSTIPGVGTHQGLSNQPIMANTKVCKVGRTTGLTFGRLKAELRFVPVLYSDGRQREFERQYEIETDPGAARFSDEGDSGSTIWDADRRLLALLVATTPRKTYATPINRVLSSFDVELL